MKRVPWSRKPEALHGQSGKNLRGFVRSLSLALLLPFTLGVYLYVSLQDSLASPEHCSFEMQSHDSQVFRLYDWMMHMGPTPKSGGQVKLVSIESPSEPLSAIQNACQGRRFMTELVKQLDRLGPSVIAIDKFYSEGACPDDEIGTPINDAFRAALHEARASIVLGRPTQRKPEEQRSIDCLVEVPMLDFRNHQDAHGTNAAAWQPLHFGVTRVNVDTLKIPLLWPVLESEPGAREARVEESLSLAAAREMDPAIVTRQPLKETLARYEHPFARLPRIEPGTRALDILCSGSNADAVQRSRWGTCSGRAKIASNFASKVVLVGEYVETDIQPLPSGKIHGVELQAKYIEAILNDQYVHKLPFQVDLGLVILFFLGSCVLELLSHRDLITEVVSFLLSLLLFLLLLAAFLVLLAFAKLFAPIFFLASVGMILALAVQSATLVLYSSVDKLAPSRMKA